MKDYPLSKSAYGRLGLQLSLATAPLVVYLPAMLLIIPGILLVTGWWRWQRDHNALPKHLSLLAVGVSLVALVLVIFPGAFALEDIAVVFFSLVAGLKWLESRQRRDAIICSQLNFFTLLLPVFYDQPFWLMTLMAITASLTLYHWLILAHPGAASQRPTRYLGTLLLLGLPAVVVLFVLFPRFEHPLWQIRQPPKAESGISDTMSPGSLSELVQSAAPAFRVTFAGKTPPKAEMYWKGLVLWDFDGKNWRTRPQRREFAWDRQIPVSKDVDYQITLEQGNHRWLYLLDTPALLDTKEIGRFSLENEFILSKPPEGRIRYRAESGKPNEIRPLDPETEQAARALPFGNPKATALGESWARQFAKPADRVAAALRLFGQAPFAYTLRPGTLGDQPVDEFLFSRKKGFCEHYASAFVFLMRAAGVPARVVIGYAGGEYNRLGNYYLIRQADAHAWAEVYLADSGWTRVDPTAAIAPERVEPSVMQLSGDRASNTNNSSADTSWSKQAGWFADSLQNEWNQLVISYDRQKQRELLARFGFDDEKSTLWRLMAALFGLFALVGLAWLLWPSRRHQTPAQRVFLQLGKQLKKRGFVRASSEGERAFIERVIHDWPAADSALTTCIDWYQSVHYGNTPLHQADIVRIRHLIRTLPTRKPVVDHP